MELLAALVVLACIYIPVCGAAGCSGLRHLENGRTFFRYDRLLAIFHCHPGYKLHGYKTNSCVSGRWARDPPLCVGSGCSSPGPLAHGTSSMNEDGSWAVFSCDSGFQLRGPSKIYCKGQTWNGTKPTCKVSDMMSSFLGIQKPNGHLILSQMPYQMSNSEKVTVTNVNLIQLPTFRVEHWLRTTPKIQSQEPNEGPETGTEKAFKSHLVVSGTERSSFSATHIPVTAAITNSANMHTLPTVMFPSTSPPQQAKSDLLLLSSENTGEQSGTGFQNLRLSQSQSVDKEEPTETSRYTLSTPFTLSPVSSSLFISHPLPTFSALTSQSSMKSQPLHITPPLNTTTTESGALWTGSHSPLMNTTSKTLLSLGLSRRPVCTYPPVPAHGTFYYRNLENPGPSQYRHYIQYACYPGYTLAHGDVHRYCQQGGTWSGITPVCLELTPCSLNNGGCSQLCSQSHHYDQSSNQTESRAQCLCRPGFILLDDGRTCRDVDECVEGQHQCQQRCINTFGSFKCSCDDGYQPTPDQAGCTDVDECRLPVAVTGCMFGCVNTPGSFHCQCPGGYSLQTADNHCQDIDECAINQGLGPCMEQCHNSPGSYLCSCTYGYILAGDGHSCIAECPPGYRKQPSARPDNSTAQRLKDECVDINECQDERCEWQCVNLPGSHRCICPKGYTLQGDGQHCKDIDECSRKNGGYSHLCINQKGGYKCGCPATHRLSHYSWKKCVPQTVITAG